MSDIDDIFNQFKKPSEEKKVESSPPISPVPQQVPSQPKAEPFFETPVKAMSRNDFDLSPEVASAKHTILIYALKGEGKTTLAFSFPGTKICFAFDRKSSLIREYSKDKDKIIVYDGIRYLDKSSPQAWLESAEKTWKYINALFESIKTKPDWVVVDGGEVLETTLEMVMRARNNIMPFQGVTNRNVWKERRMYLDQFYRKCFDLSTKGVVWTSYIETKEIIEEGTTRTKKDIPRWIDVIMLETDTLIKVERETDKMGQRFFATVETSKWNALPCSPRKEITARGIDALKVGDL